MAGALGVEMIGGSYRSGYGLDLTYGIIATVEEMFEMTGIVIFSYALMDHIERDSLAARGESTTERRVGPDMAVPHAEVVGGDGRSR